MAEEGVFFTRPLPSLDTIDKDVANQLKLREKLFAKNLDAVNGDVNFLQSYINGNNCFVRLTSGVAVIGNEDAASKNVLHGGVLSSDGKQRAGVSYDTFADSTGAYNWAQQATGKKNELMSKEGFVPMPGIVDLKVTNRGNSGFTREADITVKCYSLEQLSILEKLYLRPGFKCVLEWGHNVWAKGSENGTIDGSPNYAPQLIDIGTGQIEEDSDKEGDTKSIKAQGSQIIKDTQNNYDYMVGLIKNYDWSYDRDGYTLNIELLGKGAITTFLQEMHGGSSHEESKAESTGVEFDPTNQSVFGNILSAINDADKRGYQEADDIIEEADIDRIKKVLDDNYGSTMTGIEDLLGEDEAPFELKIYRADFNTSNKRPSKNRFNYISMRFLLGMINYLFLPKASADDKNPEGKFNTDKDVDFYLTYPEHFSIDPGVCLLPKQTGKYGVKTDGIISGTRKGEKGDIMDIYVSTDFLYSEYLKLRKNDKGAKINLSVGAYLNSVLAAIEVSLGNINELTLYNDYYLNKKLGPSKIIDLQLVPRPEGQEKNYTMIYPKGINSFVQDFSFRSELSNSMINLIVNQAILTGVDAGKATSTGLASFNSGIYSRFASVDQSGTQAKAKAYEKAKEDAKAALEKEFAKIFEKKKYDSDTVKKAYENGSSLIKQELDEFLNKEKPKRGHIGAKVEIKMMGIGGLKALQFFTLPPEVLPTSYSADGLKVGFQISNVSHDFSNQSWTTTISANAVILSQE